MPGPAHRLRDRDNELSVLASALDRALRGGGSMVAVEGPAGIGKTALLDHAASAARSRGMRIARASGSQLGSGIAFGLAAELLESAERGASRGLLPTHDPAEAFASQDSPDLSEAARFEVVHGLYWALADLAAREPLALLVDDIHWADEPSMIWLDYVARRIEEQPLALIAATRPDERRATAMLARATFVTPAALGVRATAELLGEEIGAQPGERFAAACHERTGGVPLLVRLLGRALAEAPLAPVDENAGRIGAVTPASLRRAVEARLAGVTRHERALAEAVAVMERPDSLSEAAAVAGVDAADATGAADRLTATGVLAGGPRLEFAHPLVRDVIYDGMPPHRRAAMHAHAARLLTSRGATPEQAAEHLLRASPAGSHGAVAVLVNAARRSVTRGAPRAAVGWLRRALEEPPAPGERPAVLLELATAEILSGEGDAIARLEEVLEADADVGVRAAAAKWLGFALALRGDSRAAHERVRAALRELPPGHDDLRVDLEAEAAAHAALGGAGADALRCVLQAAEGVRGATAAERALLAISLLVRPDASTAQLVSVSEAALGDGALVAEQGPSRPHVHLVLDALMDADRFDLAERLLHGLDAEAARRGSAVGIAAAATAWAWFAWSQGRLLRAEADARAALDAETGTAVALGSVAFIVEALRERGELDAAQAVLAEHGLDGELPEGPQFSTTRLARGRLRAAEGRLDAALADLEEIGRLDDEAGRRRQFPWRSSSADALLAAGERDRAVALAEEELDMARRWGAPRPLGIALASLGRARGGEAGRALLLEGVAVLEGSTQELELARALIELGRLTRIEGQRAKAREVLRRGHVLAARHGAFALAGLAEEELRVAGGRPRRARFDGPESLTAGERRVAQLALQGLTNRQISEALFVTRKTVEKHLGEVYRKLEISGRSELAGALGAGLDP